MTIVKTLNPSGFLVAANGVAVPSEVGQVVEDIIDAVNASGSSVGDSVPGTPTLTVGSQVSTTRSVTIQLKDAAGINFAAPTPCIVWLSNTALGAGDQVSAGALDITTGVVVSVDSFATATQGALHVLSDSFGVVVARMTFPTAASNITRYCNVIAGAKAVASGAVTITNA